MRREGLLLRVTLIQLELLLHRVYFFQARELFVVVGGLVLQELDGIVLLLLLILVLLENALVALQIEGRCQLLVFMVVLLDGFVRVVDFFLRDGLLERFLLWGLILSGLGRLQDLILRCSLLPVAEFDDLPEAVGGDGVLGVERSQRFDLLQNVLPVPDRWDFEVLFEVFLVDIQQIFAVDVVQPENILVLLELNDGFKPVGNILLRPLRNCKSGCKWGKLSYTL